MYNRSPTFGGNKRSLINPPTYIEYKGTHFLIVDAPSSNNLPLYLEVCVFDVLSVMIQSMCATLHRRTDDVRGSTGKCSRTMNFFLGIWSVERDRCGAVLRCNIFACPARRKKYSRAWLGFRWWWASAGSYRRCLARPHWCSLWPFKYKGTRPRAFCPCLYCHALRRRSGQVGDKCHFFSFADHGWLVM